MRMTVTKENQLFTIGEQVLNDDYSFSIKAEGVKSKEDIQEVIRQCRLVESHLVDGLEKKAITKEGDSN